MGQIPGLPGEEVLVAVRMTRMDAPATHADIEEVFQRRLAQIARDTDLSSTGCCNQIRWRASGPAGTTARRHAICEPRRRQAPPTFFGGRIAALFGVPQKMP